MNVPFDTLKEKLSAKVLKEEDEIDYKQLLKLSSAKEEKQEDAKPTEDAEPHMRRLLRVIEFELQHGKVPMRYYFCTYPARFELYGFVLTAKWFVGLVTSSSITTFCTFFISIYTTASSS